MRRFNLGMSSVRRDICITRAHILLDRTGQLVALIACSLRCDDAVRFVRNFCRVDEATALALDDPKQSLDG